MYLDTVVKIPDVQGKITCRSKKGTTLYNIPSTGLRFFTVYGPAGRPDMFYYSATQKLVKRRNDKNLQSRRYEARLQLY